jgi:hypothetical protein
MMYDEDGAAIACWFYEGLFASEELDLGDIPYALDEAVATLREQNMSTSRWALFIHVGG